MNERMNKKYATMNTTQQTHVKFNQNVKYVYLFDS